MNDDLQVIEHDPLAGGETVHRDGADIMVGFETVFDLPGDGFEVRLRSSRTNDEEISEARNPLEIEDDNVFRLFVRCEVGAVSG